MTVSHHHVLCYLRQRVRYTRGAGNLFNDVRPPRSRGNKPGWRRADLVIDGYSGIGRHLFLDVAIPDPCCPTARAAGSATSTGVAASAKEKYKQNKYNPLAQRVGGKFIPAIIERFGAFGDALVGLLKTLTGEAQRDPLIDDDYVFSQITGANSADDPLKPSSIIPKSSHSHSTPPQVRIT